MSGHLGGPPGAELTCLEDIAEIAALHADWSALAERTGADPFFHPDWFDVWWAQFAAGSTPACIALHRDGVLVGILPFCIREIRAGPVRLRVARLAGTDPYTILLRLPVLRDVLPFALRESIAFLIREKGCHAVSFTPVSELSDLSEALAADDLSAAKLSLQRQPGGSHVVFELPAAFDDYLRGMSKKRRAQFRRDLRALRERYRMQERVTQPDRAGFDAFISLHDTQWQSRGRGGHFTDWPGSRDFYHHLADRLQGTGTVQLHELRGSAGVMTSQFALVAGRTCHWRLPARIMDPELERLSIGKVGLLLMIERLIADGVTLVEAGVGEYDYKMSCGGRKVGIEQVIACPDTFAGRSRIKILLSWAHILNQLYYRLWFKKLAPRLRNLTGAKPRPLWHSWSRTRL